jgi:integrase
VLPARSKLKKIKHHDALPYQECPAFMAALRENEVIAARALEFTVLTAARTNEVAHARWGEIDLKEKCWTVPAERMKAGVEHTVALSDRAIAILNALPRDGDWVFSGGQAGKPLAKEAMNNVLGRMGYKEGRATVHGFRSTFRDWAAEVSSFPAEVIEMALAHTIKNKTEAAYRRGDLLHKRRKLMEAWAAYCERPPMVEDNVTPIRKRS